MSEIEKIQRYIDKYSGPYNVHYGIPLKEVFALRDMMRKDACGAICMAFIYGQAKGYRAAKAEVTEA